MLALLAVPLLTLSITNESVKIDFDAASKTFSFTDRAAGRRFVRGAAMSNGCDDARAVDIADATFGKGRAIECRATDGGADRVMLFPKFPMVLVRSTIAGLRVVDRLRPITLPLDMGTPLASLRVLGTGGLSAPSDAKGSYMWMAAADTTSRRGVACGWLTTEKGSGVVLSGVDDGAAFLQPQIDYGKLRVDAGRTVESETFAIGFFADARAGLELWADAVARVNRIKLPPQPSGYCTWYHSGALDEKRLPAQVDFAAKHLKDYGFDFLQIDDGWQDGIKDNGPRKNFTRVREHGPYAGGMKGAADAIRARGFTAGLWLMPFAGTYNDPWFRDRQHWFAKREDGSPYDVFWGGTPLDMTHPEVREYVRGFVGRMTHEWGFQYLKLDGLFTGTATEMQYVNDAYKYDKIGNAVLHDASKTNIEMYRDGLKLVRDAGGKDVFLLGCAAPQNMRSYGGAFGLVDAMRMGPDNGQSWTALLRGPDFGARNFHLHRRIWYNDPDPLYVRAKQPLNIARMISAWVAVSGQLSVSSEDFAALPAERLDLLRLTLPAHGYLARPVDSFERAIPRIWLVSDDAGPRKRYIVGLFNWDVERAEIDYPLERLGLAANTEYIAFDLWKNALVEPLRGSLKASLPPAVRKVSGNDYQPLEGDSSSILSVRPLARHPQVISTSRHITQGLVDVVEERWSDPRKELAGTSKVVGGARYELRLATRSSRGVWKLNGAAVSAAGATVHATEEPGLVRVVIESPTTQNIQWQVRFKQ